MAKQVLPRNKVLTKAEFDKMANLPVVWNDEKIPPLVSLSKPREQFEKISIQSLNQSEVKSIYTVDRQQFGRNVLDMMNRSSRTQKQAKSQRLNIQPVVITQNKEETSPKQEMTWETPINGNKIINDFESTRRKDMFSSFQDGEEEEEDVDYSRCEAVKMYRELVEGTVAAAEEVRRAGQFQFQWMASKKPSQLLASVLTNQSRLNLYVHYLLNEIYLNEQAKTINDLHQQPIQPYNPNLKETYENILCLISKITSDSKQSKDFDSTLNSTKKRAQQTDCQKFRVSLFQNGVSIDINPKMNELKREKAARIRKLKNEVKEHDTQIQELNKYYQDIITNLAIVIQNLKREEVSLKPPFEKTIQESVVKLVTEPEEEEMQIRNKNHTFGMREFSHRSSKQSKKRN